MSDEAPSRKAVKVGVHVGGGPPPGYQWNVAILDLAHREAIAFLSDDQYSHLSHQVRELATLKEPTQSPTVDVRPIEDFHEIRDKGGILGRVNVRVFFFVHHEARTIVVLGTIKKQNDGPTPDGDRIRMKRRKRLYLQPSQE